MKRGSSTSINSTRRRTHESCGSVPCDISERLQSLSLPNSHLVEAVLKQHEHVFTDVCRDRLRNLLQVIVNSNASHKKQIDGLNEQLKMGHIKDIEDSIEKMQKDAKKKKNQASQAQIESTSSQQDSFQRERTFTYGPTTSSMICNVTSSVAAEDITDEKPKNMFIVGKKSEIKLTPSEEKTVDDSFDQSYYEDKKVFSKGELSKIYRQAAEVYRFECFDTTTASAYGDHDSDVEVIFEAKDKLNGKTDSKEYGDSKKGRKKGLKTPENTKKKKITTTTKGHISHIPRSVRARHLSSLREEKKPAEEARRHRSAPRQATNAAATTGGGTLTPIPECRGRRRARGYSKRSVINVPSFALKAYITLIMDTKRNCMLYETFRKQLIKPIEVYKEPYLTAVYDCWMDYMVYIKNILDYLQPYIKNLLHVYYTHQISEPEYREYDTRIPKMLINGIKNMKLWRIALHEAVDCYSKVFPCLPDNCDVHQLYRRIYKKIDALPKIPEAQQQKPQQNLNNKKCQAMDFI
ncbi:uncharacterized protein [Atheta coriaria]|uniref:uncharacterized protein isoform X2 n=1 Tax=Dalotia coriaria TaxID=877792 RepID=UPI0031F3D005